MKSALELEPISPDISFWQAYDSAVKADLYSTAINTPNGTYLIDPIPLPPDALIALQKNGPIAGIFVTNINHSRAAATFAQAFAVPIYVQQTLDQNPEFPRVKGIGDGQQLSPCLTAVAIDGGPIGELALHYSGSSGTIVVGDALINFEPYGFGILPDKYCLNPILMRQSLRKLLSYKFERLLFAHGTPILSDASSRLEQLLATIQ